MQKKLAAWAGLIGFVVAAELVSWAWQGGAEWQRGLVQLLRGLYVLAFLLFLAGASRKGSRGRLVLFSVLPALLVVYALEVLFFALVMARSPAASLARAGTYTQQYRIKSKELGYKPKPFSTVSSILTSGPDTVYNVVYAVDSLGRRLMPYTANPSGFAAFFGCSVTFGEGLPDTATLPSLFSRCRPDLKPYNYAFSGYGPQQMLAVLSRSSFSSEMGEKNGVGVYVYIDAHVPRAIGDMDTYTRWAADFPYYRYNTTTGQLERKSSFRTGRRAVSLLYTLLGRSYTLKYFGFNWPPAPRPKDYQLTAAMAKKAEQQFLGHYPDGKFYTVIYPGQDTSILPYFIENGFQVINLSSLFTLKDPGMSMLPYDPHPTRAANLRVAEALCEKAVFQASLPSAIRVATAMPDTK